jgi:AcrR family transcriptional regulator
MRPMPKREARRGVEAPDPRSKPRPHRGRRPRRTQEERSAETRAKVIRATTECLAELGFRATTMTAIAQRAGVTWGAMQHQFGAKEAILDAVLESSLEEFEAQLATLSGLTPSVEVRVRAFIRKSRELLRGPSYRAFVEIQLNRGRDELREATSGPSWGRHVAASLARAWARVFRDLDVTPSRLRSAQRFAYMVLSGIAAEAMLFPDVDFSRQHLAVLEQNLLQMLNTE